MKVLIAEDDRLIRQGLAEVFRHEGYEVLEAFDGETALQLFQNHQPQLVCLDIMMPKKDGYEVCRTLRKLNSDVPIVFITAKSQEVDKVVGLDLGADDFIVKPFGVKEVTARIRAILRRCGTKSQQSRSSFCMQDVTIYPQEFRARRGSETVDLSRRDVLILQLLYERRGQAVERLTIFQVAWGLEFMPNSRSLDQHISQLRKRIEHDPADPQIIKTVHGIGYRYDHAG